MAYKFNNGRGAVICDNCRRIVAEDIAPDGFYYREEPLKPGEAYYCPNCLYEGARGTGLPKWPALIVVGENVTPQQAMEIIIRTSQFWFCCNDRVWEEELYRAMRVKLDPDRSWIRPDFQSIKEAQERYGVLDLEYLTNDQIASSYVGGPHGWCDWHGIIGCNHYNIGKWPSVEIVYGEWLKIAQEFPFLKLECQLMSGEQCEEQIVPLVQFSVAEGRVKCVRVPNCGEVLKPVQKLDRQSMTERFTNPHAERGCSIETFKRALAICERRTL